MDDFYCSQIISGKVKIDVVFETERVIAFHHTNPYFEQHIVLIPKNI
jgi:histidine triad (HIT) family protein